MGWTEFYSEEVLRNMGFSDDEIRLIAKLRDEYRRSRKIELILYLLWFIIPIIFLIILLRQ